jgi:hypothetical protein
MRRQYRHRRIALKGDPNAGYPPDESRVDP